MFRTLSRKSPSGLGLLLAFALAFGSAEARSGFRVLYTFKGNGDGATPDAGLLMDRAGNLYGTTQGGGTNGYGTVFQLAPGGTETVLHSFDWNDGAYPDASLIQDKMGNLYGTTVYGGTEGAGSIFELMPGGQESVLYSFSGNRDGAYPASGLLADKAGNFFGSNPGYYCDGTCGAVYRLAPDGKLGILHKFSYQNKGGAIAYAVLIADAQGNLYGTAATGGGGACACGVVYVIPRGGKEKVLHTFAGAPNDGYWPSAGVIADAGGNLYGTTSYGGKHNMGTVFKLAPDGTMTLPHSFAGKDGNAPSASLISDTSGNLYGTTTDGGPKNLGVVFRLAPDGTETVLHTFSGGNDGATPYANLIMDKKGNLYGTAESQGAYSEGIVFEIEN